MTHARMISPTICIPRIDNKVTQDEILNVIKKLHFGKISQIDIRKTISVDTNKVFIHFDHWYFSNSNVNNIKEKILNNEVIKVVYDKPWYWKIMLSKYN
jgi:hypothetical protein